MELSTTNDAKNEKNQNNIQSIDNNNNTWKSWLPPHREPFTSKKITLNGYRLNHHEGAGCTHMSAAVF